MNKGSTCWSRSNDLWVMSPTRFLCAQVLALLNDSHGHKKHSQSALTHTTITRMDSLVAYLQSTLTTDSPSHQDDHLKCQTTQLLLRCNPDHTQTFSALFIQGLYGHKLTTRIGLQTTKTCKALLKRKRHLPCRISNAETRSCYRFAIWLHSRSASF